MIDDYLQDFELIAKKYHTDIACVVVEFTHVQSEYLRLMVDVPYIILIEETEKYFMKKCEREN